MNAHDAQKFLESLHDYGPSEWSIEQIRQWTDCLYVCHGEYQRAALRKLLAHIDKLAAEPRVLGYEDGLETVEECDGHAVFTGCEGDSLDFSAFFADKDDAEAFIALRDPEDAECARLCDPQIVVATLAEQGIVAANDFKIETHEQLRARITEHHQRSPEAESRSR